VLVYAALALTLISGAEYFAGLRSRPGGEPPPSSAPERSPSSGS
jgi:hypothetical protein